MTIGSRILAYIQEKKNNEKFSPSEFARQCGVSRAAVSKWISGEREPGISTAVKIAQAMGITVSELVGEESVVINEERLIATIEGVETYLHRDSIRLSPRKKGELIVACYNILTKEKDEEEARKQVLKLVYSAA